MNFFRKKLIIKYYYPLKKEDAEGMFKKIPDNFPKYFFTIPKTMFNVERKKFVPYLTTIKTCPGFINLYKRSLLFTSPFDIYIELDDNKIISARAGKTDFQVASIHQGQQFLDYVPNNKEYKFILKINLPFLINSNVSMHMSESFYHFNQFNVLPGIIPSSYKGDINFFIPVKKEKNEIYIKKGDPLFLITPLCETGVKLKFKKIETNDTTYLTFSTLKKHILKNLI